MVLDSSLVLVFFFFKQKTAYEIVPCDWSSDVCSSDLAALGPDGREALAARLDVDVLSRRANILVRSLNQAFDSLSHQRDRLAATPSIMPTKGWLTSAFMRERVHPILHLA